MPVIGFELIPPSLYVLFKTYATNDSDTYTLFYISNARLENDKIHPDYLSNIIFNLESSS